MPFIKLINYKNALWAEYGVELLAVIVAMVAGLCVLCCDNLECAVLIVQLLTILYCGLWVMALVQMRLLVTLVEKKKKANCQAINNVRKE